MNHRKIAITLMLLLCVTVLLSGTLLILHAGHDCRPAACPVCAILAQTAGAFLSSVAVLVSLALLHDMKRLLYASPENRFVPERTPVRRKVKLLD